MSISFKFIIKLVPVVNIDPLVTELQGGILILFLKLFLSMIYLKTAILVKVDISLLLNIQIRLLW